MNAGLWLALRELREAAHAAHASWDAADALTSCILRHHSTLRRTWDFDTHQMGGFLNSIADECERWRVTKTSGDNDLVARRRVLDMAALIERRAERLMAAIDDLENERIRRQRL